MLHETQIQVRDKTNLGEAYHELMLSFTAPKITVRELIAERVRMEVDQYNNSAQDYLHTLVRPSEAEETINGYRFKERRFVDAEKQVAIALQAFETNGYFLLIDDKQVETLNEEIELQQDMVVSFVKLTQLVGG